MKEMEKGVVHWVFLREGVIVVVDGRLKGSNLLERPTKAIIEQKIPCLFS